MAPNSLLFILNRYFRKIMTKISYQVVVNESHSDVCGSTELNFCKTEVNFTSENPFKARKQAIEYLNRMRRSFSTTDNAFFQFFIVLKDDSGREENLILSNGYNHQGNARVKEENLKIEQDYYRDYRYALHLPSPVW